MMRRTLTIPLLWAAACSERVEIPATQILLEVHAESALVDSIARVETRVSERNQSGWLPLTTASLAFEHGVASFHFVPRDPGADDLEREIVVRGLDRQGSAISEARRLVNFQRRKERVLRVTLAQCGSDDGLLCADASCHGETCKSCEQGTCVDVPRVDSETLPIVGTDGGEEQDGGIEVPGLDAATEPDEVDAGPLTGIAPKDAGSVEAGSNIDGPACAGDVTECMENTPRACRDGAWVSLADCGDRAACIEGRCVPDACRPTTTRCAGLYGASPQLCTDAGSWTANPTAAENGVCELTCVTGACSDACTDQDAVGCSALEDRVSLQCDQGHLEKGPTCAERCTPGRGCEISRSCSNGPICGLSGESCCTTRNVPGGEFKRAFDGTQGYAEGGFGARISPFAMDRFEVTLSRIRRWVASYSPSGGRPEAGQGKSRDPRDVGWQATWPLPADATELVTMLRSCGKFSLYTLEPGLNEDRPVNCIDWYTAQAFCIWDGGRLPTEAEWNFAASAGSQQRVYPWLVPGAPIPTDISDKVVIGAAPIARVGSLPAGDGFWGHSDLGGNVQEWVLDSWASPFESTSCDDCANTHDLIESRKVTKGSASEYSDTPVRNAERSFSSATNAAEGGGFRCARSL